MTVWQQNNPEPPTGFLLIPSGCGDCFPFTQQGGRGGGGGADGGRQTERQRMLTHSRPSGLMGKKETADTGACRM